MLLSIVMMVKNEEKNMKRCLECLKPILNKLSSELIILDTGSTDGTVEIAKQYTDQVYVSSWNNNFAEMRNKSIGYAKGEWLFILDADEFLNETAVIIDFFDSGRYKKYNTAYILMKHFTKEKKFTISKLARVFKKDKDFKYTGAVHEQPVIKGPIYFLKTDISHYGYFSKDQELMDRKFERNVKILEEEIEREPENIYYWYQLSQSYGTYNKPKEALEIAIKAYKLAKDHNVSLIKSMYIYTNLALMYFQGQKFEDLKKICEEALALRDGYIDLYFYLGYADKKLGYYSEAVTNYEKYIELIEHYDQSQDAKDTTITTYTADVYEHVYADLCFVYNTQSYYDKAIAVANRVTDSEVIKLVIPFVIKSYIETRNYNDLKGFYEQKIKNSSVEIMEEFIKFLEMQIKDLNQEEKSKIYGNFASESTDYGLLCQIRIIILNENEREEKYLSDIRNLNLNKLPAFYGDAVYYLFIKGQNVGNGIQRLRCNKWQQLFEYIRENHAEEFDASVKAYVQKVNEALQMEDIRFIKALCSFALTSVDLNTEEYQRIFYRYLDFGVRYLQEVYHNQVIENECAEDLKDDEDAFLLYILHARWNRADIQAYARYLRKALEAYPAMNQGIELLKQELEKQMNSQKVMEEISNQKQLFKHSIQELINQGLLSDAKKVLVEYEKLHSEDVDIYAIKGVIAMMEGNLEESEKLLLEGIGHDTESFDLLYNLAYLYQITGQQNKAVAYYKKALLQAKNTEDVESIQEALGELKFTHTEEDEILKKNPKEREVDLKGKFEAAEDGHQKRFFILSSCGWGDVYQRMHHISRALAKFGHEVIYISPSETIEINQPNIQVEELTAQTLKQVREVDQVKIYTTITVKYQKKQVYNYADVVQKLFDAETEASQTVIVTYMPYQFHIIESLKGEFFHIYECVDDHSDLEYITWGNKNNGIWEQILMDQADAITTTAASLYLQRVAIEKRNNVYMSPNAVNEADFTSDEAPIPEDLKHIPEPRIVYTGAIYSWFDSELFYNVVKSNPDKSFVVIGFGSEEILKEKCDNLYLLGPKKHSELKYYLRRMSIGIIPFKAETDIIVNCDPIKQYEYIACGLPVITTYMPEAAIDKINTSLADTKESFNEAIMHCLNLVLDEKQIHDFVVNNTWDARAALLCQLSDKHDLAEKHKNTLNHLREELNRLTIGHHSAIFTTLQAMLANLENSKKFESLVCEAYGSLPLKFIERQCLTAFLINNNKQGFIDMVSNSPYINDALKAEIKDSKKKSHQCFEVISNIIINNIKLALELSKKLPDQNMKVIYLIYIKYLLGNDISDQELDLVTKNYEKNPLYLFLKSIHKKRLMISLCMIVKNEEKQLEKCLDGIKGFVDEIIIVDTGSSDRTKSIASEYTDKVYDFEWCNDFAKARNYAIEKAHNDWILVLDADEVVTYCDQEKIFEFLNENPETVGRLKIINMFEDGNEIKKHIERVNRLFNKKYFRYEGVIHEQIVAKNGQAYRTEAIALEIDHHGYMKEIVEEKNKLDRNISLLRNAILSNPQDAYLHYQIGKSYYMRKDYKNACTSFETAIGLTEDFKFEYTQDLVESYGYALLKLEYYEKALMLKKYEVYFGQYPDYSFVMGLIYMNNALFDEAIKAFESCIGMEEGKLEGITTYLPRYNIGVIYEALGYIESAYKHYELCEDYLPAKQRLVSLRNGYVEALIESGKLSEAEALLKKALEQENIVELKSMLAIIKIMNNEYSEAETILTAAHETDKDNVDILYNLAYLYQQTDRKKLALKTYKKALNFAESSSIIEDIEHQIARIEAETGL